jgi:hypothetical protein
VYSLEVSGQRHALAALPRENNAWYPRDRVGGSQDWSGRENEDVCNSAMDLLRNFNAPFNIHCSYTD